MPSLVGRADSSSRAQQRRSCRKKRLGAPGAGTPSADPGSVTLCCVTLGTFLLPPGTQFPHMYPRQVGIKEWLSGSAHGGSAPLPRFDKAAPLCLHQILSDVKL